MTLVPSSQHVCAMALSCLDDSDNRLQSFDLSDADWRELEVKNRRLHHLRMDCCSATVVLKRSSRGTKFFAHRIAGPCTSADESEEHRHLKMMAVEIARSSGWQAATEVAGTTPTGEPWRADVLAVKGNARVAIEIQWSGQTNAETLRRQEQYRLSGIRGLWLLRQPGFPIVHDLPAACIGGSLADGFQALIPAHERMLARHRRLLESWRQALPMDAFLRAAFERRLGFLTPLEAVGENATIVVETAIADCWNERCREKTQIITSIEIATDQGAFDFSLPDLTDHPHLLAEILQRLPSSFDRKVIQKRYSHTQRRSYVSNGCARCNRLFGEFMLAHDPSETDQIATFPARLDSRWLALLSSHPDMEICQPAWWVRA